MESKDSFIVLQPGSESNNPDKYRVCSAYDWASYANGAIMAYAFLEYDTPAEAYEAADRLNRELS